MNTLSNIKNFSIGADIEDIERFRSFNYKKDKKLLDKILTKNELDYCFSKEHPSHHLAARFVGKEAILKALAGLEKFDLSHKEIEIINNKKGVPEVKLNKKNTSKLKINLSLSHCQDKAIAFAVVVEFK